MAKITAIKNGPYKVYGPEEIKDAQGNEQTVKGDETVWLCRCGASKNKPFCDGSHIKIGFKADK
ncbi:MAG: CDGSH iron-sulfur domain-containing protein [Candidatus Beckwithbacteria bacterium]